MSTSDRYRIVHLEADGRRAFGIDGVRTAQAADRHNAAALRCLAGMAVGLAIGVLLSWAGISW